MMQNTKTFALTLFLFSAVVSLIFAADWTCESLIEEGMMLHDEISYLESSYQDASDAGEFAEAADIAMEIASLNISLEVIHLTYEQSDCSPCGDT